MIVIDSSAFISYFNGDKNKVTDNVESLLEANRAAIVPVILVELLSEPTLPEELQTNIIALPMLEPLVGYWARAGMMRAKILGKKLKARLADTLIAQMCIDHDLPLLTLDSDFEKFAKHCGLKLC